MEDPPDAIVRPRLQAAGADLERVRLSGWHFEVPDDAAKVRDEVRQGHYDLVILDSMQQHFRNLYHGFRENRRGMDLMFRLAKELDCSVLFVHHFNKGKHPSVEGAIGGQGIIQNMTKAIFVLGQHKATLGTATRHFACERINSHKPPTLSFEIMTKRLPGYSDPIPYLEYTGISEATSWDVFEASKQELRGSAKLTSVASAAEWLGDYFDLTGDRPLKVRDVERAAMDAGRYYSRGTFDRARGEAGIEKLGSAQLKAILGDEFDWLSSEDRPPKTFWIRRPVRPGTEVAGHQG